MDVGGYLIIGIFTVGLIFFILLFRSMIKKGDVKMFPGGFSWKRW